MGARKQRQNRDISSHTLEELSCGVLELNPKTKLDSYLSPLCEFQDIDANDNKASPDVDTESLTF